MTKKHYLLAALLLILVIKLQCSELFTLVFSWISLLLLLELLSAL